MPATPLTLLPVLLLLSCGGAPPHAVPPAGGRLAACLAEPLLAVGLPRALREVSGLARHGDHLLAHGDEVGEVWRIALADGAAALAFTLAGRPRDDFEGIALRGDSAVLMTSTGSLYFHSLQSQRGRAAAESSSRRVLRTACELEGLAATPDGALLLPCKGGGDLAILRWHPERGPLAPLEVPARALRAAGVRRFRATAIEYDPATGHLLVLSSDQPALLELRLPTGPQRLPAQVVSVFALDPRRHRQAEGLALHPDGRLAIADEGGSGAGQLTVYHCPLP